MTTLADDARMTDRMQGAVALNTDAALAVALKSAQDAVNNYFGLPGSTAQAAATPVSASPVQEKMTLTTKCTLIAAVVGALASIVYLSR